MQKVKGLSEYIYMIAFSKNCFYVNNKYEIETKVILNQRSFFKDYQLKCLNNTSIIFQCIKEKQDKDIQRERDGLRGKRRKGKRQKSAEKIGNDKPDKASFEKLLFLLIVAAQMHQHQVEF